MDTSRFKQCRILVIGDLMLDEYVFGDVERISPEAPVPVIAVDREEDTLGGAGNVVNNLIALGAQVAVAGVVGTGAYGDRLLARLTRMGADASGVIRTPERPTTRKTRIIGASQQMMRIDRESAQPITDAHRDAIAVATIQAMADADVVVISDYHKGLLVPDLLKRIIEAANAQNRPVIADPKGMDYARYAGASIITPNQKEAGMAAGVAITDEATLTDAARRIKSAAHLDRLLITRGAAGMALFENDQPHQQIRSVARQVFDVSGAGDTVVSVLALALASGDDYLTAATAANVAAGIVVSKVGTATVSPAELEAALAPAGSQALMKLKDMTGIKALGESLRRAGRKIVLTNGCFDLIHAGHLNLFADSRRHGDVLVVAIDDDASVARLKGPGRPVIGEAERVRTLGALDTVDYLVVFASDQLDTLIETLKPDVLTKGSNYSDTEVNGRAVVERCGGRVALIPVSDDCSASAIIESIKHGTTP